MTMTMTTTTSLSFTWMARALAWIALFATSSNSFVSLTVIRTKSHSSLHLNSNVVECNRRNIISSIAFGITSIVVKPIVGMAAEEEKSLRSYLYTILRVREATLQEARLINSGKFKDVQRANVKLAIRFILKNYRLADTFIAASAYLEDNSKRISAGEVGSTAVQNLQTILEYFDSSDVSNLKVSSLLYIDMMCLDSYLH